jgi:ribosome-binding protein aMBF1 (putative translation factor)
MSAPMKKRPIEIEIRIQEEVIRFKGIPAAKLKALVISLEAYREETLPWREIAAQRLTSGAGEAAHMVRAARERAGLTQVALAAKLGMPQANLSQVETGKRTVGKVLAKRLSRVLGLDYRVFL